MSYESNLEYLEKYQSHLLPLLDKEADFDESLELEVSLSRNSFPILKICKDTQQIYLNSPYDPIKEAKHWAELLATETHQALVVYGAGFFYHLKAILPLKKFKKIVVYEPSLAIFKAALQEIDLNELGEHDFLLLVGDTLEDNLVHLTRYFGYLLMDVKIEYLLPYGRLFASEFNQFLKRLKEVVRISRVNLATGMASGEKWLENAIKNLNQMVHSPGVRHFFNQFTNVPAIIVSAGPSLEKNIHLLKELKEKAVIICAGSSIRAMRKNGIMPHFLLAFDGDRLNVDIYNDLDLSETILLYNYKLYHEVVEQFQGKKVYLKLDVETFSDMVTYKSGGYEYGTLRSGFSVSHSSLDLAMNLGCNPVVLIGQDLAYTSNKRYAEGQETSSQIYLEDDSRLPGGCFLTKDFEGNEVVTDSAFESIKIWFERMICNYYQEKVKIINASEAGLAIKGTINMSLEQVIEEYCQKELQLTERIENLYQAGLQELRGYGAKALCIPWQINVLMDDGLKQINKLLDRLRELRLRNISDQSPDELQSSLAEIINDYQAAINYKEYEILFFDLNITKIPANRVKIAQIGRIDSQEKFDQKLQHWMNILGSTKLSMQFIRNCNQQAHEIGEISHAKQL